MKNKTIRNDLKVETPQTFLLGLNQESKYLGADG
jgi:hypothetical protein